MSRVSDEPTVLGLWLAAYKQGWSQDEFCAILGQETKVYKHVEPTAARYVAYCSHPFERSDLLRLAARFDGPPPSRTHPLAAPPDLERPKAGAAARSATLDRLSSVLAGSERARSPPPLGPSPPRSPPAGGGAYHRMVEQPRAGGDGGRVWPLALLFGVVVLASMFLNVLTHFVHGSGLPSTMRILFPICALCFFLATGVAVRAHSSLCKKFYLPSSVIGGVAALLFLQIWHAALKDKEAHEAVGQLSSVWSKVPSVAIDMVFATLFIGRVVPPIREVWHACSLQLAYGQVVVWGQYFVGLSLGTLLGDYALPPHRAVFGVILPIGFEGGHGTAAGMRSVFERIDWQEGYDFCVASATVGLLAGLTVGILLVNWYRHFKGPADCPSVDQINSLRIQTFTHSDSGGFVIDEDRAEMDRAALELEKVLRDKESERKIRKELMRMTFVPKERQEPAGIEIVQPTSVDTLAYHLVVVFMAVMFGHGCKAILITLDRPVEKLMGVEEMFASFPTFPLAMLGGMLLQLIMQKSGHTDKVDGKTLGRISSAALDFLVVSGIATVKLSAVADGMAAFALLMLCGILWNVFMIVVVAPWMFEDDAWFERGITELGQSTGVTATGILLLRLVDPTMATPAFGAFALKQLLHEPFMGGGIWTSVALPLVNKVGPWPVVGLSFAVCAGWVGMWKYYLLPQLRPYQAVRILQRRHHMGD